MMAGQLDGWMDRKTDVNICIHRRDLKHTTIIYKTQSLLLKNMNILKEGKNVTAMG